jgi:hypothetical protein
MGGILDNQTKETYKEKLRNEIRTITDKSPRLNPLYDKLDEVITHYDNYEKIIRNNMKEEDGTLKEGDFLDHHKIAAAFCCSVMKVRPIDYRPDSSGKALTWLEETANEQCAYLLGLQVVQNFWSNKGRKNISPKKKEIYSKVIKTPVPNDNKKYIDWFVDLINEEAFEHYNYENDKLFGETLIFFIAHIYFLIESYSFEYYKSIV